MTLLLAHAARYGVIHVSDRLLTFTHPIRPFDESSNKVLLYLCADAIVTVAYTGAAYIGSTPTDVWIAQQLIGKKIERHETFGLPVELEHRTIASVIEALRSSLESAVPVKVAPKVELLIAGWRWGRRKRPQRPQPFVAALYWNGNSMATMIPPRYWWFKRGRDEALGALPKANMGRVRLQEVMKQVNQCSTDVEMRDVLARTVRETSVENPTVGKDCMSVMIPPPHRRCVEVEYLPADQATPRGVAYSPWVITPSYIHRPSVLFGGWEIHSEGWTIYLKDEFRGFAAWALQTRPRRP